MSPPITNRIFILDILKIVNSSSYLNLSYIYSSCWFPQCSSQEFNIYDDRENHIYDPNETLCYGKLSCTWTVQCVFACFNAFRLLIHLALQNTSVAL